MKEKLSSEIAYHYLVGRWEGMTERDQFPVAGGTVE